MASLCGVNRKAAAFYFLQLREVVAYEQKDGSDALFGGEIEVDENYFGGRRKGKRGRGAADKIPLFGLFKRSEKGLYQVYTGCFRGHSNPDHQAQGYALHSIVY